MAGRKVDVEPQHVGYVYRAMSGSRGKGKGDMGLL